MIVYSLLITIFFSLLPPEPLKSGARKILILNRNPDSTNWSNNPPSNLEDSNSSMLILSDTQMLTQIRDQTVSLGNRDINSTISKKNESKYVVCYKEVFGQRFHNSWLLSGTMSSSTKNKQCNINATTLYFNLI